MTEMLDACTKGMGLQAEFEVRGGCQGFTGSNRGLTYSNSQLRKHREGSHKQLWCVQQQAAVVANCLVACRSTVMCVCNSIMLQATQQPTHSSSTPLPLVVYPCCCHCSASCTRATGV